MRFFTCEGHDVATAKEPPQLHLAWRPAHLGDYRPCCHWNNTQFEAGAVVSPDFAVVSVGSDQETCVVDDAHAERRLLEPRISSATRSRAVRSSESVRGPCSASHSATAARPSRRRRARRAAAVIHAETLNPSSAAAAKTRSWTSGSTVIANFGEGLPLGTGKVYHQGRRVVRNLDEAFGATNQPGFGDARSGTILLWEQMVHWRVKVRWVTPQRVLTASTSKWLSRSSRPSQSRSPLPRTIGTTATCM